MTAPLLEMEGVRVSFRTPDGTVQAVRGLDLRIDDNEVLGIVGESGSGKSVSMLAVMGLLAKTAKVEGSIRYRGEEFVGRKDAELRKYRGAKISMIFQDPMTSLNPVLKVGDQIGEAMRVHQDVSKQQALVRAAELLDLVGIPNARQRADQYPHEFSGGMRQRAMIAMAIVNGPDLLIADEPTTALDVTIQAQVLEVLERVRVETGASIVLITHDLGVVARMANRVLVMYAGEPAEEGTSAEVFETPRHPYTLGLLRSLPRLDAREAHRLTPIPGAPPSLLHPPSGCPFHPRCFMAEARCSTDSTVYRAVEDSHRSACHFAEDLRDVAVAG